MRQYLIDARNKKGLTQVEAASKLFMSQNYLSNLETGKRQKSLSVATLKAFSKVYQIPLADLIASESAYGNA
ncbi:helix-turn-helix transcriptional regulator [Veillonella atypica]|uniref:helix-turn-helix domain-containing protein n=1 Tax=Veillonella atypica TaxID=39777 RepID=UPI002E7A7881|nr:helix-turn-helix transcriptional regulator [Veillonella atypica]